jgi:fatty-acyl-CoA synthase
MPTWSAPSKPPVSRSSNPVLHQGVSVADLARAALTRAPERVAVVQDGRSWTYRQLARMVWQFARAFGTLGIQRGEGIAALLPNGIEVIALRLATQLAGYRYTAMRGKAGIADQAHILSDGEIRLVVHDAALGATLAEAAAGKAVKLAALPDFLAVAARERDEVYYGACSEDELAALSYTGGTTGKPKGVMLPHRSVVENVRIVLSDYQLPAELRMLLCTPLSHAAGSLVLPVLLRQGTIHIQSGFDPGALLAAIARERITALWGVPTMIYDLLQSSELGRADLGSLETFIYGAAPIAPTKLLEALERIGPVFMQHFGQTEAPNVISVLRREDHDAKRPHLLQSCGQATSGVRVELLDDHGKSVPAGEICVQGRLVMAGYWKRPEATAETLKHGWLHTGDVARRDAEGYLYIVDRKKEMIVSGGFNVFPREVEDVLAAQPGVAAAAVIGVPDERWGEAVKAFVVRSAGSQIAAEELIAAVRRAKDPLHAPKSVEFVAALPLTPVGKVDKVSLRAPYWQGRSRRVG